MEPARWGTYIIFCKVSVQNVNYTPGVDITNYSMEYVYKYVDQKRFGCHAGCYEVSNYSPEVNLINSLHAGEEAHK